jgi:hypothetical protein
MSLDRVQCSWCRSQNDLARTTCANCGGSLDVNNVVTGAGSALGMLARSGADISGAFEEFAKVARSSWPSLVETERDGMFGRGRTRRIVFRLPSRAYVARREGPGVVCEAGATIRGAIVHLQPMPVAEWSEALKADIAAALGQATDVHRVLGSPFDHEQRAPRDP